MIRFPARTRILAGVVALAALLPLLPPLERLDARLGWTLLTGTSPIDTATGVLVELDAAVAEADGTATASRRTLAALVDRLADAGVHRIYIDASFSLVRQPAETAALAAALSRFGPERAGVHRPAAWQRSGMLVVPELAPHVSVLEADQPVDTDGWVSQVGRSQEAQTGLPVAPRWLVGQPRAEAVTVHPAARLEGVRRVAASRLLATSEAVRGLEGAWVVIATGPDLPGQRSLLRSQGALTRGQATALAAATVEAGREPRRTLPVASSVFCALLAAATALMARMRLGISGVGFASLATGTASLAVAIANGSAVMIPFVSALTGLLVAFIAGRILAEPRWLTLRAWLVSAVGMPLPGWRAFRSDLDPAVLTAHDGTILAANPRARALLRGTASRGTPVETVLGADLAARVQAASRGEAGQAVVPLADGALWVDAVIAPVPGDPVLASVVTLRDVTALQAASHQLTKLVETDALTGLMNRLGLNARFGTATDDLLVFLIDLDGFKPVNDIHGHAAGDSVLRAIGARLGAITGLAAARIGGDEFVVLAPADGAAPASLAAAIEDLIKQPIRHADLPLQVGASIGWAHAAHGRQTLEDVLHEADQAMYRVKQSRPRRRRGDHGESAAA